MKIPSHDLEAFYCLTKVGNFTRAAKSLGLSQPAFSQRIKNLEAFLEQALVIRDKKGIELTPEGEKLLRYVKVQKMMEDEFLNEKTFAQVRVGGFSSVMRSLVIPSLAPLLSKSPHLSVEFMTRELAELFPLLRQGKVDFIITNKDPNKEGYDCIPLGIEENVLVAHKKLPNHEVFLDHDPEDVTTSSYFSLSGKNKPEHIRYLDDVYGLLDGVKLGLGRAILPKHLIQGEKNLLVQNPRTILKVNVFLVMASSPYRSKVHQEVIDAIKTIKL